MKKEEMIAQIRTLSFEQALAELEALVSRMESGKVPLEELIANFERGNLLAGYCRSKLDALEKRIEVLTSDDGDQGNWADFEPDNTPSRKIGGNAPVTATASAAAPAAATAPRHPAPQPDNGDDLPF